MSCMKSSLSSAGSSAGKAIYSSFFILHFSLKNESLPPPFCDGLKTKPRSKRHFPIGNAPAQPVTRRSELHKRNDVYRIPVLLYDTLIVVRYDEQLVARSPLFLQFSMSIAQKHAFLCNTVYLLHKKLKLRKHDSRDLRRRRESQVHHTHLKRIVWFRCIANALLFYLHHSWRSVTAGLMRVARRICTMMESTAKRSAMPQAAAKIHHESAMR